jgi:hypothetical protein
MSRTSAKGRNQLIDARRRMTAPGGYRSLIGQERLRWFGWLALPSGSLIGQERLRWFGWLALPSGDGVLCVLDGAAIGGSVIAVSKPAAISALRKFRSHHYADTALAD